MEDEMLDIINKDNGVVDWQMKSAAHARGLPHRVSAILLKDQSSKYLIPTAAKTKVDADGLFHSAAGHVPSGESYRQSAKRELWEETGLDVQEEDLISLGTFWLEKEYPTRIERERFEVFQLEYQPSMGEIRFNDEQTNEQWFSEEELKNIYLNDRDRLSYPLSLSCKHIFDF